MHLTFCPPYFYRRASCSACSVVLILLITIFGMVPIVAALGGAPADGTDSQPNPIASLLPFALMGLTIYLVVRWIRRKSKRTDLSETHRQRPPTDRQMDYIDSLMQEREIEPWMLEKEPETIQEASELIEKLLKRPIRDPGPM